MAYNITVFLNKLTGRAHVDFGGTQEKFAQNFWSEIDSKYLDLKVKVVKWDNRKDFCLVQNLTMVKADFTQFMRLENQLVTAAENFGREKKLSQCWSKKSPETWMNKSNWLTNWSTL